MMSDNTEPLKPLKLDYEYFTVKPMPQNPKRKTRDYFIVSKSNGVVLGDIQFTNTWRQHTLIARSQVIWSDGCLDDVSEFLKQLKNIRTQPTEGKSR